MQFFFQKPYKWISLHFNAFFFLEMCSFAIASTESETLQNPTKNVVEYWLKSVNLWLWSRTCNIWFHIPGNTYQKCQQHIFWCAEKFSTYYVNWMYRIANSMEKKITNSMNKIANQFFCDESLFTLQHIFACQRNFYRCDLELFRYNLSLPLLVSSCFSALLNHFVWWNSCVK